MGRPRKSRNYIPPSYRAARYVRLAHGLTVQDVYERTGIPYYRICLFERGTKPLDDADLATLARVYGIEPRALLKQTAFAELSA